MEERGELKAELDRLQIELARRRSAAASTACVNSK
jgi:hypothetical protein